MRVQDIPAGMAAEGVLKSQATQTRIRGLDELRGLSIGWVVVCHGTVLWTWMPSSFSGYGFHGVVLFFIISGYLITRILNDSRGNAHYFSHFYVNRLFRIWPLMLLALLVSGVVWPEHARQVVFNLLMISNYAYAYGIEPMMRTDVMWSLAIEEQFYLIWPVLTFLLLPRAQAWVASAIVVLGLSFDAGLIPGGQVIIFKTTHGNMQYIAMGALIALGPHGLRFMLGAWGAFFAFYLAMRGGLPAVPEFRWIWYGVTFLLGLLVHYTVHKRPIFEWKPLAELGKLCYGIYLIHFFISWTILEKFGRGVFWHGFAYLVISLVLAMLSFRYFEQPALRLRSHVIASERAQVMLFAAMGLMTLVCVIALIPTLKSS